MGFDHVRWILFLGVLAAGSWQDIRERELTCGFLVGAGGLGGCLAAVSVMQGRDCLDVVWSCGIGLLLLGLNRWSCGGVGEGDGWFFVVSGMFLTMLENGWLLFFGLVSCFFVSLPLAVWCIWGRRGRGGIRLPFLPFLLPGAIGMMIHTVGIVGLQPV